MSIGKTYTEQGRLLRQGRTLVLERADGGCWRLEIGREADALLGRRVVVDAVRSGFDVLEVRRIVPC